MADKQVKITASVDETSIAKAIRHVRELTSEVSKLVVALGRAQSGLGSTRVTGVSASAGVGSTATLQQAAQRAGSGGGGLTDNLTKAVASSAALFRTAAEGSKGAFRMMSDALRSHVTQSDQEIQRLVHSLQRLETTYDRLRSRQASGLGGQLTEGAIQQAQSRYYEGAGALRSARDQRRRLGEEQGNLGFEAGEMGGGEVPDYAGYSVGGGKPPWYRRSIFGGVSQAIRGPLNAFGISSLPPGAGIAGMTMAGLALMSRGVGMYNDNAMSNISYQLDAPQFAGQRRAAMGSFYGGTALAVRNGDIARSMALGRLAQDRDYRNVVSSEYRGLLRTEMEKQNPSFTELPTLGNAKRLIGQSIGSTIAEMKQSIFGSANNIGTDTQNDIAMARARQQAAVRVTQTTQQMLEAEMQRDPMFNDRVNSIYGGALGSLSMARAAGISGGLRARHIGPGVEYSDSLQMLKSRALSAGYDPGEWVGMIQGMQSSAGRGSMSAATGRMLSMTHGGLGNATDLFGVGSQFGGGRAAGGLSFLNAVQGKTGAGGLDPVAASHVFGLGAGLMTSGSFADASGLGIVGALGDAGFTGTPGGDLLRARQLGGGAGALGQMLGGKIDPLQMGLNASAALRAAPGGNYAVHKGLMDLDPGTLMEVMRTGKVPEWMASRGITASMVRSYSSTQNSTAFARYSGSMGAGSAMGAAAGRYTRAGGLGYLRGSSRGDVVSEVNRLAEVLVDTTGASRESARGRLLLQASMDGLLPNVRGRGARQSASMQSSYGQAAGIQGYNEAVEGTRRADQDQLIKSGILTSPDTVEEAERMRVAGQDRAGLGGDTDVAIEGVDHALRAFVASLRRSQGAVSRPGPLQAGPLATSAHR